jgi:hypothetical protein
LDLYFGLRLRLCLLLEARSGLAIGASAVTFALTLLHGRALLLTGAGLMDALTNLVAGTAISGAPLGERRRY